MPEAQIPLAHAAIYIATAPKSNRAYAAIGKAMAEVKQGVTLAVPKHLRDTHYQVREKTRARRRLPILPRLRRRLCPAGLSAGGPHLLRAHGDGLRETGQGTPGLLAGAIRGGTEEKPGIQTLEIQELRDRWRRRIADHGDELDQPVRWPPTHLIFTNPIAGFRSHHSHASPCAASASLPPGSRCSRFPDTRGCRPRS